MRQVGMFTVRVSFDPGEGESPTPEVLATVASRAVAEANYGLAEALAEVDPGFEVKSLGSQLVARPLAQLALAA